MTEHRIQRAVIEHVGYLRREYPCLDTLMAIPNGGVRNKATAGRLKAEGVKAGVWDLFLPHPIPVYGDPFRWHGLWIELKAPGGSLTPAQQDFGAKMLEAGYACYVPPHGRSVSEGDIVRYTVDAIREYLQGRLDPGKLWQTPRAA